MAAKGRKQRKGTEQDAPVTFDMFRHLAAASLAEGQSDAMAAQVANVHVRTIQNWKDEEGFGEYVEQLRTEILDRVRKETVDLAVADQKMRLYRRNERSHQLAALIRAEFERQGDGSALDEKARTSSLSRLCKLWREERENEKQAAIEAGQWNEKREINFASMTDEQIIRFLDQMEGKNKETEEAAG